MSVKIDDLLNILTSEYELRSPFEDTVVYPLDTSEEYERSLVGSGYRVDTPLANELFIDIDSPDQLEKFNTAVHSAVRNIEDFGDWEFHVTPSSSGGKYNLHIRIKLPFEVTDWQRIALQAAFGSDTMREFLSCCRLLFGDPNPSCFKEVDLDSPLDHLVRNTGTLICGFKEADLDSPLD